MISFAILWLSLNVLIYRVLKGSVKYLRNLKERPKPDNKDEFFNREITLEKTSFRRTDFPSYVPVYSHIPPEILLIRFKEENIKVTIALAFYGATQKGYIDTNGYYVNPDWIIMRKPI
ncbi:hypothetical protein VOWphi5012_057 [Vibrio phage phi50-12]|uniref:Uncharacterized protein n=1 Tax=Vibrio phage phi50-12 TaxID=2654972 RepID=A0A5P8PSS1_9CAUD|nr:hypothetical protein KNU82_gp057 [Vibrio phage phi50-12]QFR59841.1 hypothetical protein VOWphi5012_057 [Vibrio phage phi50-12]